MGETPITVAENQQSQLACRTRLFRMSKSSTGTARVAMPDGSVAAPGELPPAAVLHRRPRPADVPSVAIEMRGFVREVAIGDHRRMNARSRPAASARPAVGLRFAHGLLLDD